MQGNMRPEIAAALKNDFYNNIDKETVTSWLMPHLLNKVSIGVYADPVNWIGASLVNTSVKHMLAKNKCHVSINQDLVFTG